MVILWLFIGLTAQQSIDYEALGELTDEELTGFVKKYITKTKLERKLDFKPLFKHFITQALFQRNCWMITTVTMIS